MFKVTARDQGHYKGPSGAFVTYCNISCFYSKTLTAKTGQCERTVVSDSDTNSWKGLSQMAVLKLGYCQGLHNTRQTLTRIRRARN